MNRNRNKFSIRLKSVLWSGSNTVLKATSGLVVSLFVIHFKSLELWGEFTPLLVAVNFLSILSAFGNKEYLIREFSLHPSTIKQQWNKHLWSRLPILILASVGLFFICQDLLIYTICFSWLLLIALHQSFESLNLFFKNFRFTLALEVFCNCLLLSFLLVYGKYLTLLTLLLSYLSVQLLRTVFLLFYHRKLLQKPTVPDISASALKTLIPFFLLGLGGFLIDRADLLCVSYYLSPTEKASYQIISNLSNMGLLLSTMFLIPFTKNIYRLRETSFQTLHKNYGFFGIIFAAFFIVAVSLVGTFIYHLPFMAWLYVAFFMNVAAYTLFLPYMFLFTKLNWQGTAVKLMLISGAFTLTLSILLVPKFKQEGAAFACALGQLFLLLSTRLYFTSSKYNSLPSP